MSYELARGACGGYAGTGVDPGEGHLYRAAILLREKAPIGEQVFRLGRVPVQERAAALRFAGSRG